jgi:N-acetylmuramoyl-L-alanine amidase
MIAWSRLRPAPADRERPSPNHGPRPAREPALLCVVLHATADGGSEAGAEGWLCDPRARASAHLHIRRDGTVVRLLPDARRAWHAGESAWRGRHDVNSFSLGWELANRNDGREPFTGAQYAATARLAAHYVAQGLPADAFVSHARVALPPGRKTDPAGFDWERFRALLRSA